jgi:hypothetical protein
MQANPEKFQVIAVGKKSFDKSPIFQIGTANISCDEVVKLLGVKIWRMKRKGVVVCIVV